MLDGLFVTVTGFKNAREMAVFTIGSRFICEKEPSNPYDDDAIRVVGPNGATVGYLANNAGLYIQAKGTDHRDEYVTVAYQDVEPGTMVDRGTTITVEFTTGGASD